MRALAAKKPAPSSGANHLRGMSLLHRALDVVGLGGRPRLSSGDRAPRFTLPDSEGKPVSLEDLTAAGPVMLVFFPKAFTAGCTRELRAYGAHQESVSSRGAQVVAISTDDVPTLARFKTSLASPYRFLSDPEGKVAASYGGVSFGTANRITVTVGRDGVVTRVTAGLPALFPQSDIQACPTA